MTTFLDDTVYLGLLAPALIFTIWTFFEMRDFGEDPSSTTNSVSSSLTDMSSISKSISDASRAMAIFSVVFLSAFSIIFWEALGIYTLSSSYPTWGVVLGLLFISVGILMILVLILYLLIFSAAFLKNRIADFRPR